MTIELERNLRRLIEAAIRAPSGDNLQPWRFIVDAVANRIVFYVDESRDPSPMNSGQRMSRIAVGAAVENLVRCVGNRGCDVELGTGTDGNAAVSVRLHTSPTDDWETESAIHGRTTNRRQYDGRQLAPEILGTLKSETPEREGIRTHWILDRDRLTKLAELIGRGDALMFGKPLMRGAFLENVRFDLPVNCEAEEGLPIGALELAPADQFALRMLPHIPNWMFGLLRIQHKLSASTRRLANSASGICLVDQPQLTPQMDILAGRSMQSAWLAITSEGMFAQPMMSLVILDNLHCRNALPKSLELANVSGLLTELREAVPEIGAARPAFLMRFGFANAPTVRTGRLGLEANTSVLDATVE